VRSFFDRDLLGYDVVWAAAGTPRSVFPALPAELARAAGATVADVADAGAPAPS
jgi:prolyl-tRNA editing enzyme YbaK/EbsC (Cys-tRNA(Pro) deacylase)